MTLHPEKVKKGRNISKEIYVKVKASIISSLRMKEMTFTEILQDARKNLKGFKGSLPWYVETVKLDLEARNVIARTNDKPQKYKLIKK